LLGSGLAFGQAKLPEPPDAEDWVCPMDPDYHAAKAGVCPKCGMKLVQHVPDRVEYPLTITHEPELLKPNIDATLTLRAFDPSTGALAKQFQIVHEKLIHFFVISENLEYFAHIHPTLQPDGSFRQQVNLPFGGMYRLLADFYPRNSVPQLAAGTLFVEGATQSAHLKPALQPFQAQNTNATIRLEPEQPVAGLQTRLFYSFDPGEGIQPYLGAWAHMLAASEDLIDLMHVHPFQADGGPSMQFNLIFPREGLYRIWTQIQRQNIVDTTVFTVPVRSLS
jgi:hypothetical protein